jgi:hypothetical protein
MSIEKAVSKILSKKITTCIANAFQDDVREEKRSNSFFINFVLNDARMFIEARPLA